MNMAGTSIGQSIAIGVGGDPMVGCNFTDLLEVLEDDPGTDALVIYGEPGGMAEEQLYENRDLNLTTDFRDVLGELVTRHTF